MSSLLREEALEKQISANGDKNENSIFGNRNLAQRRKYSRRLIPFNGSLRRLLDKGKTCFET